MTTKRLPMLALTLMTSLALTSCGASDDRGGGEGSGGEGSGGGEGGGGAICTDTCETSFDGECDDGGSGSTFDICSLGSDCADCGPRTSGDGEGGGGEGGGCTPDCTLRSCGADGCGGSCGSCGGDLTCVDGSCESSGGGGGGGCDDTGCPSGQSCIMNRCIDNNAGDDDGAENDTCRCEIGTCSGSNDGCRGVGWPRGEALVCIAHGDDSGEGTCKVTCSERDDPPCADGRSCLEGINGVKVCT